MKFFLSTEVVGRLLEDVARHAKNPDSPIDPEYLEWFVCPICMWVSLCYAAPWNGMPYGGATKPSCPRDKGEAMAFFAANIFGKPGLKCDRALWIRELAPRISAAMHTALRVGGTNAVIQILDSLMPIEMGIDDSNTGVMYPRSFEELRPGSVRKRK